MPTRRDFEAMAAVIRDSETFACFGAERERAQFAAEVATMFAAQNPRFNRERFIRACQPSWVAGTTAEVHYHRRIKEA